MIRKDHAKVDASIALAYPDIYDLGMSYYGFQILYQIEMIIGELMVDSRSRSKITFRFGKEMEKCGYQNLASDLYHTALKMNPEDDEIKQRLKIVTNYLTGRSKYDYLIEQKIIIPEQLQKALAASKTVKRSVDYILLSKFPLFDHN